MLIYTPMTPSVGFYPLTLKSAFLGHFLVERLSSSLELDRYERMFSSVTGQMKRNVAGPTKPQDIWEQLSSQVFNLCFCPKRSNQKR